MRVIHKAETIADLIGGTALLKLSSLSKLTGCHIYVKCEFQNPGGSIKDRAALRMIKDAISQGRLKPGMTIVEGTAGNTGIGLSLVARSLGFKSLVVMPKGQAIEKERMIELFGGRLHLVDPVAFSDPRHFYHTARTIAEKDPKSYWWADQFENLSNFTAHFDGTGPEIWRQLDGHIDYLVAAAGTGGTIAGNSAFLKSKNPNLQVVLVDPHGSGLKSYIDCGRFESQGSSITEGIGIMRLVANFKKAVVDKAITLSDQDLVCVSRYVRDHDGLVLGSSSALNAAGALHTALHAAPGSHIVTFACDLGERSYSKLYNDSFLASKHIDVAALSMEALLERYKNA